MYFRDCNGFKRIQHIQINIARISRFRTFSTSVGPRPSDASDQGNQCLIWAIATSTASCVRKEARDSAALQLEVGVLGLSWTERNHKKSLKKALLHPPVSITHASWIKRANMLTAASVEELLSRLSEGEVRLAVLY